MLSEQQRSASSKTDAVTGATPGPDQGKGAAFACADLSQLFETYGDQPSDGAQPQRHRITPAKAWGHLRTITRHKVLVAKHCFACGLVWQGIVHDLSKYSPTEFLIGARYYQGFRSPNAAEREEHGVSLAWQHHKGRNRHHYEYWLDVKGNGDIRPDGKLMPLRFVVEMFCDRIAACKVYKGDAYTDRDALAYYTYEHQGEGPLIHPQTDALLKAMLEFLAEKGEQETFAQIRSLLRKRK